MEPSIPLLKALLPKVPLIGKTIAWHTLGLTEHKEHWDLRTELTVNVLRSFIIDSPPEPVSRIQRMTLKDRGVKGRIWISRYTSPSPEEDDIRQALFKAIDTLKEPGEAAGGFQEPELRPVEAEWTGYRAGATDQAPELNISEEEKYNEMMKEVSSQITVLYLHGGAYYLCDPATHRATTKKLAKLTKGRCLSVRYRLAPQNPFPAALLDALVSYFTLLYPPPGSFHQAVDPRHIVFAGDSAGGNLCLVLLQTLLEFRRQGISIKWNGQERSVPLPAGLAVCSPWADITQSLPSCESNGGYDYLPSQSVYPEGRQYPPCSIWPCDPPRNNFYAEDALLGHPLVSPLVAKDWEGSCPMYIDTGRELLTDEDKFIAMKIASQGVPVVFEEYDSMPHCFAMVLENLPASRFFFDNWSAFIRQVVNEPGTVKTKGTKFLPKSLVATELEVGNLSPFTSAEVVQRVRDKIARVDQRQPDPLAKL